MAGVENSSAIFPPLPTSERGGGGGQDTRTSPCPEEEEEGEEEEGKTVELTWPRWLKEGEEAATGSERGAASLADICREWTRLEVPFILLLALSSFAGSGVTRDLLTGGGGRGREEEGEEEETRGRAMPDEEEEEDEPRLNMAAAAAAE